MTMALLRQYSDLQREYAQMMRNPADADRFKLISDNLDAIHEFLKFINTSDDSRIRQIVDLYAVQRKTWVQISVVLRLNCPDTPRMHLNRYMSKYNLLCKMRV